MLVALHNFLTGNSLVLGFRCPVHWHSPNHWSHSLTDLSLAERQGLCWSLSQPCLLRCTPLFVFQVLHPPPSDICKALLCLCSEYTPWTSDLPCKASPFLLLDNSLFPGRFSWNCLQFVNLFLVVGAHSSEVVEMECNALDKTLKWRQIFISFYAIWCFYIANISHLPSTDKTYIPISFR